MKRCENIFTVQSDLDRQQGGCLDYVKMLLIFKTLTPLRFSIDRFLILFREEITSKYKVSVKWMDFY